MKNLYIKILVCVFILSYSYAYSQRSTKEEPISFSQKNLIWKDSVIVMPELDMDAISIEDSIDTEEGNPPRFGYSHPVNFTLNNSGEWKILSNGDRIWHLVLTCPDAKSINLLYDKFWLPQGAKLFIYGKNKAHHIGAFTSINNKGNQINLRGFATGLVYSDTIVVEYYEPRNVLGQGVISIANIVHGYRFITFNDFEKDYDDAGGCQVNINCYEGQNWQNEKNAVALIVVNGNRACTGSLMNTTANDKRPLFLTANHCLSQKDAVLDPNCDYWSFLWHYESPDCSNPNTEPSYYSTNGAIVIANNSISDFALLSLEEDPEENPEIMTYYLGWDRTENFSSGGVCIHHPKSDIKKISTYTMMPTNSYCANSDLFWDVQFVQTQTNYSVVEDGSSGSSLLNSERKVIGQLYGPYNSSRCPPYKCNNPSGQRVAYGKFSVSWNGNGATDNRRKLQPWLDPLNSGATTLDGLMGTSNVNLYIRDSISDNGNEPTNVKYMYNSPDIWIGDSNGNPVDDIYEGGSHYVCVRIHNKRGVSSTGTEKLYVNWAKAGIDLPWPSGWDGKEYKDIGCDKPKKMSGRVGDSLCYSIPIILPYNSVVVKIPWTVPDAEYYNCGMFKDNAERWHFCLLARVHDSETIRYEDSDSCRIDTFVVRNNNVAWKNISVIDGSNNRAVVWLQNHLSTTQKFRLHFTAHPNSKNELLSKYAETYIRLSPNVFEAWASGGKKGNGISVVDENRLRITSDNATLENIPLPANAVGMLETEVNFLSEAIPQDKTFTFDIAMYDANGKTLYGGEHYMAIRDDKRTFDVVAMQNQTAMPEESVTFNAINIGEPATYVWYNAAGDSIASGTTLSTTAIQSQQYRLSVQATADGYKGYDTVSLVVRNGAITSLSPNPATNQVVVSYSITSQVQSGTIQIANTNGIVLSSTPFTASQTSTTLNLQNLTAGQYSVRLVSSTGEVMDSKTLIVQ